MHRNAQERPGTNRSARERRIMSNKGHHEQPINTRTSTHLPSAVVVVAVLLFLILLRILFE